jgi:Xaa-Pro dipeptidase
MDDLLRSVPLGAEAAFPKEEFAGRAVRLQQVLADRGIDLYVSSGPENIFYLTGQQTPGYYTFQCVCVPRAGTPFLVLRGTEAFNARLNTYIEDIFGYGDGDEPGAFLAKVLKERGWLGKRIAVDHNAWFLTQNLYGKLTAACGAFLDGSDLVEPFRRVKSVLEMDSMEKAAAACAAGMRAGLATARAGATDNDVAAAVMDAAIRAGSEYVGIEPFVTAGRRSGVGHTTWRRNRIETGDVLVIENCGCYNRYHAALFRTVAVGPVPQLALDQYKVCLEGLEAAIAAAKPGNTCADVHNAVQAVIDRAGFGDGFRKRAGYSIGISFAPDWGEGNIMSVFKTVNIELVPNMTFHLPITLREYYRHTVAVSETIAITETGCRALSDVPRDLVRA